jgi:AraC-like DNA-binding protein
MDVLADVLSNTRLDGKVFCRSELRAPWGMTFDTMAQAVVHVVARGTCWLRTRSMPAPVQLVQGDVLLLPHGSGHTLLSDPAVRPVSFSELMAQGRFGEDGGLRLGGDGPPTVLLCGAYRFEHDGVHPLLSLLPDLIHVPADGEAVNARMEPAVRMLIAEFTQPGPGSAAVTSRLVDVLFIHVIRSWLERQPAGGGGWLGAVRDPQVGRALARMHAEPRRDWTVESLATEVAMSRAAFARRFRELVGEPPLEYLTRWRMDVASRLLRETDAPLARIAERVGYASEFAFNRTFHRVRGLPPGRYREQVREATRALAEQQPFPLPPGPRRPRLLRGPTSPAARRPRLRA